MADCIKIGLGVDRQVGALADVAAEEAVERLIGSALPGVVWLGKVDVETASPGQLAVCGHLPALVTSEAAGEARGHLVEAFDQAGEDCIGAVAIGSPAGTSGRITVTFERSAAAGSSKHTQRRKLVADTARPASSRRR